MNGLHQRLPELVERHEGFLAFKVTIAIQRTDYTICNHFKDKVFPDETAIFIPIRCRAVPCDSLSIGASIQNMLLKATQLGLGTLWIANTCFAYNDMVEVIPSKGQLIGAVAVGYAAEKPYPRPRKNLEEILEYM